jgi:superfamily II DNA or RNA helicase
MAGRVLRPATGKDKAIIIDHTGTVERLGFPTEDRDMTLDDGKPKPSGFGEEEKKELKPCPRCGYVDHYRGVMNNDRACPNCGFVPATKPKDVSHTDDDLQQIKKGATKEEKQRLYSELLAIASERGRSTGWVAHKYKAKFGVWPRGLIDSPIQPSPETRSWVRSQDIRYAKAMEKLRGRDAPTIGRML